MTQKAIAIGEKVKFDKEEGEFRGMWNESIAMILNRNQTRLYYVIIDKVSKINNK
jgi:hypothetical protein